MKVYRVEYYVNDYSGKEGQKIVVATSVAKAALRLGHKILGYSGRVKQVTELFDSALIAK